MIEVKESPIHGQGVYATKKIKTNYHIGNFEGDRTDKNNDYVLWLLDDNDNWYGLNGKNQFRFLNHSEQPNAEMYNNGELYSLRTIKKGEEITIHYGEDWEA